MNTNKAKEAQPILKRNQHYFKIVTLYVMDKYNFKYSKQQTHQQKRRMTNNLQLTGLGLVNAGKQDTFQIITSQHRHDSTSNQSSGHKIQDAESLSQYSGGYGLFNEELKQNDKNMIKQGSQNLGQGGGTNIITNSGAGTSGGYLRPRRSGSEPSKQIPSHFKHGGRMYKHCIVCEGKQKPNAHNIAQTKSKETNHKESKIEDSNSKPSRFDQIKNDTASQLQVTLNQHLSDHTQQYPNPAQSVDLSESLPPLQLSQNQPVLQKTQSTKKQLQDRPVSPTRRDHDIEEYQKRRISLDDFIQGTPSIKLALSKHVRKFNRELLKATCQVIGCKPINAHQIAEGVFDEMNQILNNLSESIDFENHFDVTVDMHYNLDAQDQEDQSPPSLSGAPGSHQQHIKPYKQIATVTTSAPLFKYILSKHLEKYKYSRPEYIKDFYIASDLVQSKRNILVLLAGTSGTGKSTLASLLGSRLGISTVLSTDTIRHVMRNFYSKEDNPILFASTYETAAYAPPEVTSEKKRTLIGYKEQCYKVQQELEKVIDDYQNRNESLVVEGVHLTVRFMLNMMKKYPSCIPFVICIKNEEKHKERFAVRTKHMTIDPRFNKYIKNVKSIRIIQKHLIKKAEESLIPRIDNSNVDKSIGLIHVTIVRCLRQIAEGNSIFDTQRKAATLMHHEFNLIQKNHLSSKDAQQIIKQKVNKNEIMEMYMQKANPDIEDKLKKYKRGQSMGDLKKTKRKAKKVNTVFVGGQDQFEGKIMGDREQYDDDDDNDLSPKAKSIHIIMRPDEDGETRKITEQERKNMKRQFKQVFEQFPEDETAFFEDSKAAKIAGQNYSKNTQKNKKDKKDKVLDQEEQRIREEKKKLSDQQKKIEEEKIQNAIDEAVKKAKEEQEKIEAEAHKAALILAKQQQAQEQERLIEKEKEKQQQHQIIINALNNQQQQQQQIQQQQQHQAKSQSMTLPSIHNTGKVQKKQQQHQHQDFKTGLLEEIDQLSIDKNNSIERQSRSQSLGMGEDEETPSVENKLQQRQQSSNKKLPINIVNIKDQLKQEQQLQTAGNNIQVQQPTGLNQLSLHQQNTSESVLNEPPNKVLRFLIEEDFDYDNEELNLNPSGVQIERKSFKQMFPETKSMTSLEHLKQMDTEDMTLLLLPGLEQDEENEGVEGQEGNQGNVAQKRNVESTGGNNGGGQGNNGLMIVKQENIEDVNNTTVATPIKNNDSKSVGRLPVAVEHKLASPTKTQNKDKHFLNQHQSDKLDSAKKTQPTTSSASISQHLNAQSSHSQKQITSSFNANLTKLQALELRNQLSQESEASKDQQRRNRFGKKKIITTSSRPRNQNLIGNGDNAAAALTGRKTSKFSQQRKMKAMYHTSGSFGPLTSSQTPQANSLLKSGGHDNFTFSQQEVALMNKDTSLNNNQQIPNQETIKGLQSLQEDNLQISSLEQRELQQAQKIPQGEHQHEDNQSIYSGGSGLAPSLVSHTINYFPQGEKNEEDDQTALQEQSNESGGSSDETNSMHVEDSFHDDANSAVVSYSQSTDSDHEEEHLDDVIQQKEASFNNKAMQNNQQQQQITSPSLLHQTNPEQMHSHSPIQLQPIINMTQDVQKEIENIEHQINSSNNNNNISINKKTFLEDSQFFNALNNQSLQVNDSNNSSNLGNNAQLQ